MIIDVMIIDDDNDIHEYLKKVIDWKGLGLQLQCEASDSFSALELFSIHHPKIIFVDICISNIPGITGLDLTREFRKLDPSIKVIIITGFTDFEYAQEAVSLGAIDYLTKPLDPEDINESLMKAKTLFEKEKSKYLADIAMEQIIKENLDSLRKNRISYLINSVVDNSEKEIIEQFKLLSINIASKYYNVVQIVFKEPDKEDIDIELKYAAVRKLVDEKYTENNYKAYVYFKDRTTLICLIGWSEKEGTENLEELLVQVSEEVRFALQQEIKVGIGGPVSLLTEISISAMEAQKCLNYCDIQAEQVINYMNVKDTGNKIVKPLSDDPLKKVKELIKNHKFEDLLVFIDDWFSTSEKNRTPIEYIRKFSIEYIYLFSKLCEEFNLELWNSAEFISATKNSFITIDTGQLKASLKALTSEVIRQITNKKSKRDAEKNELVVMAKKYVKQHLAEKNLGFDDVCDYIGLSKIYFGRVFSKEEGISFNSYINKERIKVSKMFLVKTNLQVNEVASKSGFWNAKYFSVLFKSIVGISPLEYRRSRRNNEERYSSQKTKKFDKNS